jgi:hypothetical protein
MQHAREMKNAYKILVGKPEGERQFTRARSRWEDNIKMDLAEVRMEGVIWIHLAQDRKHWRVTVKTVMDLLVPQRVGNFLTR